MCFFNVSVPKSPLQSIAPAKKSDPIVKTDPAPAKKLQTADAGQPVKLGSDASQLAQVQQKKVGSDELKIALNTSGKKKNVGAPNV